MPTKPERPATATPVPARRLVSQQLAAPRFGAPAELVAWLGAVQAQDWLAVRWAVGLRLAGGTAREADVLRALDEGSVIRAHLFRGTWQLVAAGDLRWMLGLVGERLLSARAGRHRQLGLDRATLRRSRAALARALDGGRCLTRAEAAAVLQRARVATGDQRLSHLLQEAELAGLLCSGPLRQGEPTYALLDERVPRRPGDGPLPREEALARLARRYVLSRGPATDEDLATWSGLGKGEARAGLSGAGAALVREEVGGRTRWLGAAAPAAPAGSGPSVHLLPPYDEYFIGYRDRADVLAPGHAQHLANANGVIAALLAVDGRLAGTWRRTLGRGEVAVAVTPWAPLRGAVREAVEAEAARYARFLGLGLALELRPAARRVRRGPDRAGRRQAPSASPRRRRDASMPHAAAVSWPPE